MNNRMKDRSVGYAPRTKIRRRLLWYAERTLRIVFLLGLVALVGCGGGDDRFRLEGSITLDGEPLTTGGISFRPQRGTRGPTAGGRITDGKFFVEPAKGTFAGTFRVEIISSRKTGQKVMDNVMGTMADEYKQIIPVRYNRQSELTAEVKKDGPNKFEFALESQP